jgi:hypothetical protein
VRRERSTAPTGVTDVEAQADDNPSGAYFESFAGAEKLYGPRIVKDSGSNGPPISALFHPAPAYETVHPLKFVPGA